MKITLTFTLNDGKKRTRTFREPDSLIGHSNPKREVLLLTNRGMYSGKTTGDIDEDGNIILERYESSFSIEVPFYKIVGWAYLL